MEEYCSKDPDLLTVKQWFFKEGMVRNNYLKKDEFQINHWYACDLSETYEEVTILKSNVQE